VSIVNLTVEKHKVSVHPVLYERVPEEFLDPDKHVKALIKTLGRCKEHLAEDRPIVVKTNTKNLYYVICPVFAAMIKKYKWAAFSGITIPAIAVGLSDNEVEEYFWSKVRFAMSLRPIYGRKRLTIFDLIDERPVEKTMPKVRGEIPGFNAEVDSFNRYRDESIASEKPGSDQHNLWNFKHKKKP